MVAITIKRMANSTSQHRDMQSTPTTIKLGSTFNLIFLLAILDGRHYQNLQISGSESFIRWFVGQQGKRVPGQTGERE